MDVYDQIVVNIIHSQELIIGPVAIELAKQVKDLEVDWIKRKVTITGNKEAVINQLVEKYKGLFGQISVEVSKESAKLLVAQLPPDALPKALK